MSECLVHIGVDVTGLGNGVAKRVRFTTTTAPEVLAAGYATIAAADTYEAVDMGQCAASLVDGVYIKSGDETIYIDPAVSVTGAEVKRLKLEPGEAAFFRPCLSDVALSVMVVCSAAEANYEYLIVGQSS